MFDTFEKIRGHTLFLEGIPKSPFVLDLGANHGEFSTFLNLRFGGTYHLIEANPTLASELRKNGSFEVVNAAVTAQCGTVQFNIAKNDEASSILTLPDLSVYKADLVSSIEVPGLDIDAICKGVEPNIIDVVKIDIEGAEVSALLACSEKTLRRIGQITVEFHCDPSFGFNLSEGTDQVLRRLNMFGFVVLDFSGGNRNNVLFINRKLHSITKLREFFWKTRLHPPKAVITFWKALPASVRAMLRKGLRIFGVDSI